MYSETQCASYAGVQDVNGTACCTASCGTCGGIGCDTRPGGQDNCCVGQITQLCGSGQDAPCLLIKSKRFLQKCHYIVCDICFHKMIIFTLFYTGTFNTDFRMWGCHSIYVWTWFHLRVDNMWRDCTGFAGDWQGLRKRMDLLSKV